MSGWRVKQQQLASKRRRKRLKKRLERIVQTLARLG